MSTRVQCRIASKPILGFGWIGVVASIGLAALIAVWASGVDIQHHFIHGLGSIIGADALLYYVATIHVWHGLALSSHEFSLVTLLVTIAALRIHPERIAWWRYALAVAWGLTRPTAFWYSLVFGPLMVRFTGRSFLTPPVSTTDWLVAAAIQVIPSAIVLAIVTKSWRVGAGVIGAALVVYGADHAVGLSSIMIPILGQGIVAATLLTWSIHARLHPRSPTACRTCDYELAGTPGARCPECGAVRPTATSPDS